VDISPPQVTLASGQQQEITVDITAPSDDFHGRQTFNINAFDKENLLVGGVTLSVEG
jgi:hypothetical protein